MINIENTELEEKNNIKQPDVSEPDEQGGVYVQGFLRIHDPESGEIILQGRA